MLVSCKAYGDQGTGLNCLVSLKDERKKFTGDARNANVVEKLDKMSSFFIDITAME